MKRVVQNVRSGHVRVEEVPLPALKLGGVLVRTVSSAVSSGTERRILEFGRRSLFRKAWERPDLVRQVVEKFEREGLVNTYQAIIGRLDVPVSLGYSSAGIVEGVGNGADEFQVGDRVACAGTGCASHAEVVWVPKNLCVPVPEKVSLEDAAFIAIGAVALQGIRLAEPMLGESVIVIGLGVIGQIALQCLKANGCRVLGVDRDATRTSLALELGVDEVVNSRDSSVVDRVKAFTRGIGADAVLITAATDSNEPVELAGEISRPRGRVTIIGSVGMNIPHKVYYERELTVKVSMSYGPGRYDPTYEEKGIDYPVGYVRWTERRNMEAFLDLLSGGRINVQKLITHRFAIQDAEAAYDLLCAKDQEKVLGILLTYPGNQEIGRRVQLSGASRKFSPAADRVILGLVGAGNFGRSTLLPALKRLPSVSFRAIATSEGSSSRSTGERYGFEYCTTDYHEILQDERINVVVVATRHDLHASIIKEALKTGKHVFVEKPLCLSEEELETIVETYESLVVSNLKPTPILMVGFNRRFSPYTERAKEFLGERRWPLSVHYRVNAGSLPPGHWVNDPKQGGGRIIGEVCHFVDFISFLVERDAIEVFARGASSDDVSVTLRFEDGSIGTIHYVASGHQAFSKERVEIFGGGKVFVIDDFKRAEWVSHSGRGRKRSWFGQEKGHDRELKALVDAVVKGGLSPIRFHDLVQSTHVTFKILESLGRGLPVQIL